jgi:hypothetical protein
VTARNRAIAELGVAVVAAIGTVACWLAAGTAVATTPVLASEPSKITMAYSPSMIALAFILATLAGVLAVVGVARLRRK